mmetsp:Transcript_56918/g.120966  ORF Transcript_56918/g.120966 Transcript_56918/m.120966 type:complete len:558 (+) Transcript_56918:96-1769(+)
MAITAKVPHSDGEARELNKMSDESDNIEMKERHDESSKKKNQSDHKRCDSRNMLFSARRGFKALGMTVMALTFISGLIGWPVTLIDGETFRENLMSILFLVGLILVILEEHVDVNKSAIMLIVAASMWTFLAAGFHPHDSEKGHEELQEHMRKALEEVGQLILFLLPAMGVVESIDHFGGFGVVTRYVTLWTGGRPDLLMPLLCTFCFFLSAVIDNLTATIVALKLLRHCVGHDRHLRHTIGGLVVIAANAGGAWSPVGDVTTTMLWLSDKISVVNTIRWLFLPSFVAGLGPMLGPWCQMRRQSKRGPAIAGAEGEEDEAHETVLPEVRRANVLVLVMGIVSILMVPVLKMITGLPPYLGMLLALGILWFVTDTAAFKALAKLPQKEKPIDVEAATSTPCTPDSIHDEPGSVVEALHAMDLTGLLFFAGVLLAVGALDAAGVLHDYAKMLVKLCHGSAAMICSLLGVSSAIVDNVPLVQAAIDMFHDIPMDDPLWQLTALAAGTGGSILSVGSIAGVTLMTMEGVGYLWYVRRISLWAALGFAGGISVYMLERALFG